ncbi:MAG: BatD family protein [Prevotellaceae bacterium]|jgi:hypothetical protein|nr:BatD family protein [Prevotellaceae bacterium]
MKTNMKFNTYNLILFLGLFFILPNAAISQVIFKAEAPNIVSEGERFNFTLTSNVNIKEKMTSKPEFAPNFNEIATGSSFYTNITNGKVEQQFSFTFTLQALKEGKFTIGEAVMVDENGTTYKTKPVTIEVVKGQVQQQQNIQNQQNVSPSVSNNASTDVFMRLVPSRTSLYRGDKLTLTLKLFVGLQTDFADARITSLPKFDGFWANDITPNTSPAWQRENVDGKIYNAIVWKIWELSPQKSGAIRIDAVNATSVINQRVLRRNLFFDDSYSIEKKIRTAALTINVKDLPAGAPASFTGAVGNYTMTAKVSKDKLMANDAVSVNVKISGTGNFSLIGTPQINFPHDFDTYDLKKTLSSNSVTFEYPLIPRSAGTFTIEPVVFSYFNPSEEKYISLTSNPMIIEVEKDLNSQQQIAFVNTPNQRDVQILTSDIRFIKNKVEIWQSKGARFLGMKNFYLSYIVIIVLFALIYLWLYKHNKNRQNIVLMRNRKAKRIAKRRLKIAEKSMKLNQTSGFYDELLKAIWGYISDKFSLPVAELSRNNVSELLTAKNVEQEYIDRLIRIVDECEFAQYAPGTSSSQMNLLYNDAIEIMSKLEQKTK